MKSCELDWEVKMVDKKKKKKNMSCNVPNRFGSQGAIFYVFARSACKC